MKCLRCVCNIFLLLRIFLHTSLTIRKVVDLKITILPVILWFQWL